MLCVGVEQGEQAAKLRPVGLRSARHFAAHLAPLEGAAAAHVRLIVWCLPFGEPHGFAGCRDCRYQVELIPPKWPNDTVPRLSFPNGVSGSSVPVGGSRSLCGGDWPAWLVSDFVSLGDRWSVLPVMVHLRRQTEARIHRLFPDRVAERWKGRRVKRGDSALSVIAF